MAMLSLLAVLLVPGVNTIGLAVMGMGQFHRFWQVLPWPYVLAAAACLAALVLGRWVVPLAVVIGALSVYLRQWHEFWREPASWAVVGVIVVCAAALVHSRAGRRALPAPGDRALWPVGAALLVAAALAGPVHYGRDHLANEIEAGPHRGPFASLTIRLTPGVVGFFRGAGDGRPPVVLGDTDDVFQLVGMAAVYAQALPEARTRAEPKVAAPARRHDVQAFFSAETRPEERAAIVRRWHVDYVLLNLRDQPPDVVAQVMDDPALSVAYRDPASVPRTLGRFAVLRARDAAAARSDGESAAGSTAP
jgi:hypothetical protein